MAFLPQIDLLRTTTAWILCQGKWKGTVISEEDPDGGYEDERLVGRRKSGDRDGLVLWRHSCHRKPRRKDKVAAVLLLMTSPQTNREYPLLNSAAIRKGSSASLQCCR